MIISVLFKFYYQYTYCIYNKKFLRYTSEDLEKQLCRELGNSGGVQKSRGSPAVWREVANYPRISREDKF